MSPIDQLPVSLPTAPISHDLDTKAVSSVFQHKLKALGPEHFVQDGIWRDMFALTGTLRTFYGPESICKAWDETSKRLGLSDFELDLNSPEVVRAGPCSWVQALFKFETAGPPSTTCTAIVGLVQDKDGEWRIWLLRTILEQLKEQGNVDLIETVPERSSNAEVQTHDLDCVIVGGGQAGLSIGGRLQALGLSYIVIDKHKEVGDCWKTRYDSCKIHLPRETGYRDWVEKFHINVWTNARLEKGEWNPSTNLWTLKIRKDEERFQTITCSHVVMAVGGGGQIPVMPEYPNKEIFEGEIIHSAHYTNPLAWKGKHGIIIGTANTAHDVAEDMVDAGLAQVTMVQRSTTYVLPAEYIKEILSLSYNETIPTDLADKFGQSFPYPVMGLLYKGFTHNKARGEPERYDGLKKAGFKVDQFGNLANHIFQRAGGHYIDMGASEKIAKGLIKIKSDSLPRQYTPDGLEFEDGSKIKADVVVFATGFDVNTKNEVARLFDHEIANEMGDYWGFDKDGEIRGVSHPRGHPIWYHGGDQTRARYFSRFVALSIKASRMGTPMPLYDTVS